MTCDGNGGDFKPEALADLLFVLRIEVRAVADRAGELADAHLLGGHLEALDVALHLGVPVGKLQAEGDRLGMDAVGAADLRRVLELAARGASAHREASQVIADDGGGLLHQQRLRGVHDVVRGQSVVQPARLGADLLGDRGGEGDDVVLHLGFDLVDAIDVEAALLANGLGGGLGARCRLRPAFPWRRPLLQARSETCFRHSRCGPSQAGYNELSMNAPLIKDQLRNPITVGSKP